jgi:hypothetical protein
MGFSFLKKLQDDHLSQRSLVELLNTRLAGKREARSHKVVHVSTVTDAELGFCPRQFALLDVLEQKLPPEYINAALQVAFDNGEALHDLCRNKWLRNDVIGMWKCKNCKEERHFSKLPVLTKGYSCTHEWVYHEEKFVDAETHISGSIDFFLDMGNKKLTVVEVKSIDKDQFAKLAGPMAKHRIRSQMYLALIERSTATKEVKEQIDLSHARILYISKGFGKMNSDHGKVLPFKEFSVQRNDEAVAKYFELGAQVQDFRSGGKMPKVMCANHLDKRAQSCPVVKQCFSGKYPAGVKL